MFEKKKKTQKKTNILWHVKIYEIQISVSLKKVLLKFQCPLAPVAEVKGGARVHMACKASSIYSGPLQEKLADPWFKASCITRSMRGSRKYCTLSVEKGEPRCLITMCYL